MSVHKQQAEKLVKKFLFILIGFNDPTEHDIAKAKECATEAVDNLLHVMQNLYFLGETSVVSARYWQTVKEEIASMNSNTHSFEKSSSKDI